MEKKAKKAKTMAEDEELYLPEGIIHHIMSYLNPQQSAQLTVLSKAWFSAWKTNPKLEFHDKYFHCKGRLRVKEMLEFRHYVKTTLARYEEEDINILEFNLDHASFNLYKGRDFPSIELRRLLDDAFFLNQQLERAIQRGVKVIRLSVNSHRGVVVPSCILEAKSLTDLSLTGCKFQDEKLFLCNILSLHLKKVQIDEEMFSKIIAACPLIQVLKLNSCNGFKRMKVASKSLKHLCLYSTPLNVEEIEVDAPNMTKFEYGGITFWRLQNQTLKFVSSSECISLISTSPSCHWHSTSTVHHASSPWFRKLNELISNLSPSKVSLSLNCWVVFSNPMSLGDIQTCAANPAKIEELNIYITHSTETLLKHYRLLLDGVFWACHPKALVVQQDSRNKEFTKFLYNKLINERRNLKSCNLPPSTSKFWLDDLKNVELEIINEAGRRRYYPQEGSELILPFNALKVVFKLEWNVN